jgi:phosphatidate cytidylyltransferase
MHLKRILTSLIAFPMLSLLIWKASVPGFSVFIAAVALLALYEYGRIVFFDRPAVVFSPIAIWGAVIGLLIIGAAHFNSFPLIWGLLVVNFMGAAILSMPAYKTGAGIMDVVEKQIQGVLYVPVSLAFIVLIRHDPHGVAWIFFLLFMVFAGDVGAFYAGKIFGRRKLSPAISPNKTLEGSIGGLLLCAVVGYAFARLFLPHLAHPVIFLMFVMVNLFAQAGDLFESELKRAGGIKDSGNILPGHGGILDRIDALLFAAPVTYIFKEFVLAGV